MANINFSVTSGSTLNEAVESTTYLTIYVEDLGVCLSCIDRKGSCWACLTLDQQVYQDDLLTNIVPDGYFSLVDSDGLPATWQIIGGFPQNAGFSNP